MESHSVQWSCTKPKKKKFSSLPYFEQSLSSLSTIKTKQQEPWVWQKLSCRSFYRHLFFYCGKRGKCLLGPMIFFFIVAVPWVASENNWYTAILPVWYPVLINTSMVFPTPVLLWGSETQNDYSLLVIYDLYMKLLPLKKHKTRQKLRTVLKDVKMKPHIGTQRIVSFSSVKNV